jgi:hypothetical protein
MKTPWGRFLEHGTAIATLLVLVMAGLIFFAVLGVAIVFAKLAVIVK